MICPKCDSDTKSENKGLIRHRTCRVCNFKFRTIEVLYDTMNVFEKINQYLSERKTPSTTKEISEYFLITQNTAASTLVKLEKTGAVHKIRKDGKNYWTGVRYER